MQNLGKQLPKIKILWMSSIMVPDWSESRDKSEYGKPEIQTKKKIIIIINSLIYNQ